MSYQHQNMDQFAFTAQIRKLGDFTNIQARTLYQRFLSGGLTMEKIAAIAQPRVVKTTHAKVVTSEIAVQVTYLRATPNVCKIQPVTYARLMKEACEEDNILLMFKDREFLTARCISNELGYQQHRVKRALNRLCVTDVLLSEQSGKGVTRHYCLAPAKEICNA